MKLDLHKLFSNFFSKSDLDAAERYRVDHGTFAQWISDGKMHYHLRLTADKPEPVELVTERKFGKKHFRIDPVLLDIDRMDVPFAKYVAATSVDVQAITLSFTRYQTDVWYLHLFSKRDQPVLDGASLIKSRKDYLVPGTSASSDVYDPMVICNNCMRYTIELVQR